MGVTEQELIAEVLAGNQRAFAELYQRHQAVLSRRLRRVLGRIEDVEDVLQVTFVEAYKNLRRYDSERPFGPWLHGIAFRQASNHLRKARRKRWLTFTEEPIEAPAPDERSSEEQVIQRQLAALLYRAMETLPAKKRIAFSLHVLEGMGFTEIGEVVDASPQTVRARVLSAKKVILEKFKRDKMLARAQQLVEQIG